MDVVVEDPFVTPFYFIKDRDFFCLEVRKGTRKLLLNKNKNAGQGKMFRNRDPYTSLTILLGVNRRNSGQVIAKRNKKSGNKRSIPE
jgi:hypothetical protein